MKILTKRNGIALIAVLAILLVLTLLIPVMLAMSENATRSAMQGNDEQRASYLARTMVEMSVAAFEDFYDMADEAEKEGKSTDPNNAKYDETLKNYKAFIQTHKKIKAEPVYMYRNTTVTLPKEPVLTDFGGDQDAFNVALEDYYAKLDTYKDGAVIYSTSSTVPENYVLVGTANCEIDYIDEPSYYSIDADGNTEAINVEEYEGGVAKLEEYIKNGVDASSTTQYVKIDNKNVVFQASAKVNGKSGVRRCVLVLPTKPSEESWIAPAELGSNQIFPNTKLATGRTNINYDAGTGISVDSKALKQPLYIFSCIGNMIISEKNMQYNTAVEGTEPYYVNYAEYCKNHAITYDISKFSFGLHPETGTRDPDNDPALNCLRTYNMNTWAEDAQLDNFVAFTATNAIQVDLPVNLVINPCRVGAEKGRLGDGFSKNASLYKVLIFQAPTIVFNETVTAFMSLYQTDNANRMTTVMLAAPKSTPYSYVNGSRNNKTVKAGKVFFAEDVYMWVIPYGETGSNYETQTVYYKNKDIIVYKMANAGDIYYFNAEVETKVNGKATTAGFSLTGYFMDTYYRENGDSVNQNKWWQIWSNAKLKLFNRLLDNFSDPIYVKDDLKWIGNVYTGTGDSLPVIDDFYVIWDS